MLAGHRRRARSTSAASVTPRRCSPPPAARRSRSCGAHRSNPAAHARCLVPKDSPITSVPSCKGKKIAVAQGSSADYHLLTVLKKAGLTTKRRHARTTCSPPRRWPRSPPARWTPGTSGRPFIEQAEGAARRQDRWSTAAASARTYSFEVASRRRAGRQGQGRGASATTSKLLNQAYVWSATHQSPGPRSGPRPPGCPPSVMVKAANDDTTQPVAINAGRDQLASRRMADAFYTPPA